MRDPPVRFSAPIRVAFVALIALMVVSAIGFRAGVSTLNLYLRKEPVALREALDTLPTKLGRWKRVGVDSRLGEAMTESLGTKLYLDRQYALGGDPSKGLVTVHIAYYTGMVDAVPHVPERCWGAAGLTMVDQPHDVVIPIDRTQWDMSSGPVNQATGERYPVARVTNPVTRIEEKVLLPIGETAMSVTIFQDANSPNTRLVGGYLFVANGRVTPSPYVVRTYAFDLSSRYAYYCKVQFSALLPQGEGALELWTQFASELLTELLPPLMRRLPDWSTIETAQPKEP